MFSRYNKAIETGIGSALMVGVVVLGTVQQLPAAIVIGAVAGLAVLTTFKTWWVPNGSPVVEERRYEAIASVHDVGQDVVHPASDSWRDPAGRHRPVRSGA